MFDSPKTFDEYSFSYLIKNILKDVIEQWDHSTSRQKYPEISDMIYEYIYDNLENYTSEIERVY